MHTELGLLRVFVGSWNVNGQPPPTASEMFRWLMPDEAHRSSAAASSGKISGADVYCIGSLREVMTPHSTALRCLFANFGA